MGSVFAPGSPFDPSYLLDDGGDDVTGILNNSTSNGMNSTLVYNSSTSPPPKEDIDVSIIVLMTGIVISRFGR